MRALMVCDRYYYRVYRAVRNLVVDCLMGDHACGEIAYRHYVLGERWTELADEYKTAKNTIKEACRIRVTGIQDIDENILILFMENRNRIPPIIQCSNGHFTCLICKKMFKTKKQARNHIVFRHKKLIDYFIENIFQFPVTGERL